MPFTSGCHSLAAGVMHARKFDIDQSQIAYLDMQNTAAEACCSRKYRKRSVTKNTQWLGERFAIPSSSGFPPDWDMIHYCTDHNDHNSDNSIDMIRCDFLVDPGQVCTRCDHTEQNKKWLVCLLLGRPEFPRHTLRFGYLVLSWNPCVMEVSFKRDLLS